jgi:ribonuclease HI
MVIYTDGSCVGTERHGGWAVRIHLPREEYTEIILNPAVGVSRR